ncbi:MAG TPA: oligosaccharide flippase family protein [Solirubrobacteraceae bacterium]|nr:oligosaccharide flippase family protein [Solirubrobacteraceae bacterium]
MADAATDVRPLAGPDVGLRTRAARGTIVNGAFLVGVNTLGIVRAIAAASILTTTEYGEWGLLMAAFTTLLALGGVGIDDKYVQQDDPDQRRAFEIAFTLQMALGAVMLAVLAVGMPLFALLYGREEIIAPGLAIAFGLPALALQMPLWAHYRRMDFVRQRRIQAIEPVVGLVVSVALALAGLGVWALVVGALAGTYCTALAAVLSSPYRLRLRWDRAAVREYTDFSWPLLLGAAATIVMVQVPTVITAHELGIAAVAAIALAATITGFTRRVDEVVTTTLYPAICAVKDRTDLLFESFWKSNRLALLWATPVGVGVALFARDVVPAVLGEQWRFATGLVAAVALTAVVEQIAFNWSAFLRARGQTRPIAVASVVALVLVLAIAVPLLVAEGLTAFGVGLGIATVLSVGVRLWLLRPLFGGRPLARQVGRGLVPTVPAAGVVLALRALAEAPAPLEAALFAAVVVVTTYALERRLLAESLGYLVAQPLPAGGTPPPR